MNIKFLGLIMVLITQIGFSQDSKIATEIKDLSMNKWHWMADKNVNELKDLFHPQAQFVHMGGSWGTDQELNIIKGGGIWYKNADIHSVAVDVIENTAILLNEITLLAEVGGNQVTNRFMVTEVYINEENGWKLANLSFVKLMTGPTRE